ncbi:MAG TPA: arginine deiminase-related protein [Saprospiraceae bacterium]|nr:arginine deiminase-related protein [Saprospiraceae bacterium]
MTKNNHRNLHLSSRQISSRIMMIRPGHFAYNAETAVNNAFQQAINDQQHNVREKALAEFDEAVRLLRENEIEVIVFEDDQNKISPDAVFPNNWITTHEDGTIITYPMYSALRRNERREDIIETLTSQFRVDRRYSLETLEEENIYLEGTGSMVLDRDKKIVYACLSPRTDVTVLNKFSLLMNYHTEFFHATDEDGVPIYHTNVMMAIGVDFAVVCLESIDSSTRDHVNRLLEKSGKAVVEISLQQMRRFAGNMLQLRTANGDPVLVMSQTAKESLSPEQYLFLHEKTRILEINIPVIEQVGGGSVRCMMAEIFLPTK